MDRLRVALGDLAFLAWLMLAQLPRGGKIATVICGLPVVAFVVYLMSMAASGAFSPQEEGDMGLWRVWHDVAVSTGLGMVYVDLACGVVFGIWALGGRLGLVRPMGWLLHVVWLPAFLMPMILKHDPYLWIGLPGGFEYRWLLLGLTASAWIGIPCVDTAE